MQSPSRSPEIRMVLLLCLVHFTGDFFHSFVQPLLPLFVDKFSLTLTEAGLTMGVTRLLAFVVQPAVGYLSDRYQARYFMLLGLLLAVVSTPLMGVAPAFPVLLLLVISASIGSSMFHPASAGMIPLFSGSHLGVCMSFFNMGGTLAFGVGPLFITFIVARYGLSASLFTMILGLFLFLAIFKMMPVGPQEALGDLGFIRSIKDVLGEVWKSVLMIWVLSVLRSFVDQSFLTFITVLYHQEGYSIVSIGSIVSLFMVAGAISGLVAGFASDRIGYRPVFYFSYALTSPFLFWLLFPPGKAVYMIVFLAGFFTMATLPLSVTMAQELAPRGRSIVSSLMMGFAFGTGGMMTPLTGVFADIYSIRPVLTVLAFLPILMLPLVHLLPKVKR